MRLEFEFVEVGWLCCLSGKINILECAVQCSAGERVFNGGYGKDTKINFIKLINGMILLGDWNGLK